ncbi:FadR/GntR family transcriptional regulator [Sphingobacterium psychroaquaticum]|uniref:DNA-binding transcriptional regulator, FadR family n=1 Tax=Sphingobacterium psychroaquaticum TaxID=561061 RepID=A0A1X7JQI9_9SPHI|nr:FCD domain-containing protein [Sphingobacterium psychroaquaticum]QBQ40955.1 FadR family transcriptional regulator [Sphingobacterium psychroaquaticum]SMG30301.1 DNA-binding transcriptional regulator, FadR family [Sphingobacterium psychroaquaticum]
MSQENVSIEKLGGIDTSSLVDKVEARIVSFIQENKLKVGDVLPKELDLAESLGVSRTVIREALLRLKTIGLIESKKHKGAVLTNPDVLGSLRKVFHPSILDNATLKDMFEMRLALEVGMADFIVNKITDQDLQELEAIAEDIVSGDTAAPWQVEDEIRFHGKLYEISENKILLELQELLIPIFQYVHQSGLLERPIVEGDFISHKELVEVLKKRDADAYRKAIRQHLSNHFARILA